MSDPPRYVLDSAADATTVLRRLARDGWTTREGFAVTDPTWDLTTARLALYGRVPDTDTVALVVLAAARGAAVVAICHPCVGGKNQRAEQQKMDERLGEKLPHRGRRAAITRPA